MRHAPASSQTVGLECAGSSELPSRPIAPARVESRVSVCGECVSNGIEQCVTNSAPFLVFGAFLSSCAVSAPAEEQLQLID